jgi:hypothetical protein
MLTLEFGIDDRQLEELRHAEALLDGAFSRRAKAFLVAGEELVNAIGAFRDLSAVFDGLPSALANDELRSGAATLEEVAHDCVAIHDLIPQQIGSVDALFSANGNIGKRLDQLRDNIKIVACIAINARIEASALKSNSQDMLTFTYDVAKLAATAESTIDQYSSEQRRAHQVLQSARDVLTEFDSRHRAQLGTVAREVERNLRAVEGRRTAVLDEASRIGDRSRQITASIGKIITALQIADITSQRFAHVHEAVTLMLEGLSAGEGGEGAVWWAGLSADERRSVAAQAAKLQVAQIDHTLADLNSETQSTETEISQLARDATAMAEQGAALYGSGGDAAQSFLGELAGRIDVAGRLLSDCRTAFARVGELNASLGARFAALHGQAASLQGIVGVVSGVRLIGLNAHLKSDGLGHEGRTLSAISRELRSSADFITVHARDLIKAIDDTLAQFEKLQASNSSVSAERLGNLADGMAAALAAFETGGERLAEALTSLTSEGEKVRANLSSAAECIRQRDDLEERLRGAREILVRIGDAAPASGDTTRAKAAAASFFGERYTMAAERNVHSAQHTGQHTGSGSAIANADDDLESILF